MYYHNEGDNFTADHRDFNVILHLPKGTRELYQKGKMLKRGRFVQIYRLRKSLQNRFTILFIMGIDFEYYLIILTFYHSSNLLCKRRQNIKYNFSHGLLFRRRWVQILPQIYNYGTSLSIVRLFRS